MATGLEPEGPSPPTPTQAYSKRLLWHRGETVLPRLDLSPQQIFFRSYAQVGTATSCHSLLYVSLNALLLKLMELPSLDTPPNTPNPLLQMSSLSSFLIPPYPLESPLR